MAPLRILVLRALVGYPLVRMMLLVIVALVREGAGRGVADGLESPVGVVLLAMVLGAVDVRRRGESILWANLGYSPIVAPALFGMTAFVGESILAWMRA